MGYIDKYGKPIRTFDNVTEDNVYGIAADKAQSEVDITKEIETEKAGYVLGQGVSGEVKKDLDPEEVINKSLLEKGQRVTEDGLSIEYIPEPVTSMTALERTPTSLDKLAPPDATVGEGLEVYTNPFILKESIFEESPKGGIQRIEKVKDERPSKGMTVNDILASPDAMTIVNDDMYFRTGQSLDDRGIKTSPDKLVAKWLAGRRSEDLYNLLYVANHAYRMMSANENELEASRRADILFTVGKGLMYQEGTTIAQGVAATADTIWAMGTDPTTWISLGYGNMAKQLAFKKAITAEAKDAVTANIKKLMKQSKLKLEEGEDYLEIIKASTELIPQRKKDLLEKIAFDTQRITRNVVKTVSEDVLHGFTKTSIKSGAKAIAGTEMFLTGFADYVAQSSKMLQDSSYKRDWLQTFISGGSGVLSGLFELGGLALRNPNIKRNAGFSYDNFLKLDKAQVNKAAKVDVNKLVKTLTPEQWLGLPDLKQIKIKFDSFYDKAKKGAPLRYTLEGHALESSTATRLMFLFGDEEVGFKGLIPVLKENGIEYNGPRTYLKNKKTNKPIKDNFANWLIDVVKSLPAPVRKEIDAGFQASVGKFVPDYVNKTLTQALNMDAAYVRESGIILNQMSQARNLLFKGVDQKTVNETLNEELTDVPNNYWTKFFNDVGWTQRQVIRAVVTHPGTTALNVYGWKAATMYQTGADFARVLFYGKQDMIKHLGKDPSESGLWWQSMGNFQKQTRNKFANMIDPQATAEMFEDLMVMYPDESKQLLKYMFAGIEKEDTISKTMGVGFIPESGRKRVENYLDKAQMLFGVKAVDFMTKQQELLYSIDKLTRRNYGVSYLELLDSPDIVDIINSGEFATKVYVPSIQEARRNTFSMKYGAETWGELSNPVKNLAKTIEDARKIPLIGLLVPFGQFVNNTFAYMFDTMGVSSVNHYFVKKMGGEGAVIRDHSDLVAKAAVGWTIISTYTADELGVLNDVSFGLMGDEGDKIREGLGMFQTRDRSGQIVEKTYEYPESLYRALGRMGAHVIKGEGVPPELIDQAKQYFITAPFRPIGGGMNDFNRNIYDILSGDNEDGAVERLVTAFAGMGVGSIGSAFQMGTRHLEILNSFTQLVGSEFKVRDKKQNIEFVNNSIRYIDEMYGDIMGVDLGPEKFIAGQERRASGSFNYGKRVSSPNGTFFRMMNQVGKPRWKAGNSGPFKDVNNRLNQLISVPLNEIAKEYENSPEWLNGTRKERQGIVNDILAKAKTYSKDLLELAIESTGTADARLGRLVKIHRLAKSEKGIERVIRRLADNDPSFLNQDAFRTKIPLLGDIPILKNVVDAPLKEAKDLTSTEMDRVILMLESVAVEAAETKSKTKIYPKVDK